jgi:hypothetical protein
MNLIKCPSCGVDNLDTASKCRMCFESMAVGSKHKAKSSYRNVFLVVGGVLFFLVVNFIAISNLLEYRKIHGKSGASNSTLNFPRGPFSHSGVITSEFDRFKGYTVTSLKSMQIVGSSLDGLEVSAFFLNNDTSTVVFRINSTSSDGWKYIECKQAHFLIDGVPFAPGGMVYDGTIGKGYVIEFFSWDMSTAKFLQLVGARSVEVKLCLDEYQLSSEHLNALRDLASRIPH